MTLPNDDTMTGTAATRSSFASGRYRVERVLGVGGQKVVYLVEDTALGRRCALSLLSAEGLAPGEDVRLQREAQAMARLGAHPNLVTVFDIGSDGGKPFIVCEFVPGGDLRGEIAQAAGPLPLARTLGVARGILSALRFVHEQGLVHRDVKPGNVWLAQDGTAKLGDFGLALSLDRSRLTAEGTLLGTPAYMAPEQVRGDKPDGRADLYAVGCMLYEMLAGRLPFVGEPMAILYQHMHSDPPPPSHTTAGIPPAIDRFVLALMSKLPERRPQSAQEALEELERAATAPAEPSLAPGATGRVTHLPFVGRGVELDALRSALEGALSGTPSVRALAGEPGIGKTRLVEELGLHARLRGAKVLWGRCSDVEGAPPYLPFVDALEADLAQRKPEDLRRRLGDAASTLVELVPALRSKLPDVPPRQKNRPEGDRYEVFQAVCSVLRGFSSDSGLLLVLEDIHWSDEPSLLLLQHLAGHLEGSRMLVVATYRDVEVGRAHRLSRVLADMRRERLYERIALHGLAHTEIQALVVSAGSTDRSDESLADSLLGRTGGNPFFVAEVLKHIAETDGKAARSIPEGVREVVGRRLSRLSEPCNRMLAAASFMPSGAPWEVLRAIVDESEDRLLDLLDEALAAQVVRERAGASATYEFTHALIRETLYAEVSTPRRVRLHRRIGEAMEQAFAGRIDAHLADLAFHFHEGGGDAAKAVEYSARAAEAAMALSAFEEAARHYERALDLGAASLPREKRTEMETRRGKALSAAGAWSKAREAFERALEGTTPEDREGRAERLVDLCEACFWAMDIAAVDRASEEAIALAASSNRPDLESAAYAWTAMVKSSKGEVDAAAERLALAADRAPGFYSCGLAVTSSVLYMLGRVPESIAAAVRLLDLAKKAHDPTGILFSTQTLGAALCASGRYTEARAAYADARTLGLKYRNRPMRARGISISAGMPIDLGDLSGALAVAEEARELAASVEFMPPHVSASIDLLYCHARGDEPGRAEELLPAVEAAVRKASGWHGWAWRLRLTEARAEIALARGDRAGAVTLATDALDQCRRYKRAKYEALSLWTRARAQGPSKEAERDLREALDIARRMGDPALILRVAHPLAELAGDAGVGDEARQMALRIDGALPDEESRRRFRQTESARAAGLSG